MSMTIGPRETIGNSSCLFDGPMRNHRQQELHMPVGPRETIGNSSYFFLFFLFDLRAPQGTEPHVASTLQYILLI